MDKAKFIIYFISFLVFFVIFLKLLMETNLYKIFKQGKILEIRLFYLLISMVMSTIMAFGITKLSEAIYEIINF